MWQKYNSCLNCGTSERPHRSKGYCNMCYGPAMQLEEVAAWDQTRPKTLSRYPGDFQHDRSDDFELLREGYSNELRRRLDTIKHWEVSKDAPASGIDIEFQLDQIAGFAGAKTRGLYHGLADYIDWQFLPEHRKVLRELLRKIEKDRPWRGVNLYWVFDYKQKRQKSASSES